VLDTGALLALEADDRALWAALADAADDEVDVLVPTSVLAQAWRGGPRQARLSRALAMCRVVSFDDRARAIGVLCGTAGVADVVDAHVALVAGAEPSSLYTSDPGDLRRLLRVTGGDVRIVRC
jgi:hypothetical protein